MSNVSTGRFNLSVIESGAANQIKNTSSINDEVIDISDKSRLEEELTSQTGINTQDVTGIKAIKIGDNLYNIPKGEDLKAFINQIKEFALSGNKLKDNFDINSFNEITGINISSQNSSNVELSLPASSSFITKGLSDKDFNNALKSKTSIFTKANQDILLKINELDKAISNNTNPESANKLQYMKDLYTSLSKIYTNFSKDINPSKSQLNALQQELKNSLQLFDKAKDVLSDEELKTNSEGLKNIGESLNNLQLISNAFMKYGGKSESAANDLNNVSSEPTM